MYRNFDDDGAEEQRHNGYQRLANGLGWFSIGLGLAEVAAPGFVADLVGISDDGRTKNVIRSPLYGMRELAAGAGILTQAQPSAWLWGRVAGDVFDLGTLAIAMSSDRNDRTKVGVGMAAVAGVMVLDVLCARKLSQSTPSISEFFTGAETAHTHAVRSVIINKSADELYGFWHDFENLPKFMKHLESVRSTGAGRTHWTTRGPAGRTLQWEAEVTDDQPNKRIAWRSVQGSQVPNRGSVTFEQAPGGQGTIVKVELSYSPPGGSAAAAMAKMMGKDAGQMVGDALRGFKQIMETGEIVHSDASIHRTMHPARPPAEGESTLTLTPGEPAPDAGARTASTAEPWNVETTEREYA
jgi:uncharacterized membrane protein